MEKWVEAFAALAHDTRLAVVRLLMQQGPSGLPGENAAQADYPIVRLADLAAERGAPLDQVPRAPRRLSNRYSTRDQEHVLEPVSTTGQQFIRMPT